MKKIIWLSSFPKSGNTWMRHLLSNYYFNEEKVFDFYKSEKIKKFKVQKDFRKKIDKSDIVKSLNENSQYWIKSQENWKSESDILFLKNHNANVSFKNNFFTNDEISKAIIYIVRDPRDVVISASYFWKKSIDWVIEKICNDEYFTSFNERDETDFEFYSTWKINFLSWIYAKHTEKVPKILIKYEDLLKDTNKEFNKILDFINKLNGEKTNISQLNFAVENSQFKKLSHSESKDNIENKDKFFRSGKSNQWINNLSQEQLRKIENSFKNEMRFLGYI